jgi:hypothetical protein
MSDETNFQHHRHHGEYGQGEGAGNQGPNSSNPNQDPYGNNAAYSNPTTNFGGGQGYAPQNPGNAGGEQGYAPQNAGNADAGQGNSAEDQVRYGQGPQRGPSSVAPGSTFDLNDPQQRDAALQWLQQYQNQGADSGNTQRLSHEDLGRMYQGVAGQAQPQHIEEATANAVQQMPQQQRDGFIETVTGWLQQHGISPEAAGVQTSNPQQMSPQDVGKMVGYAQQENPDVLQQLFSPNGALGNKAVQVGLAGLLAFAATQVFKKPGQ